MLIIQRPQVEAGEAEGNLQQFTIAPLEPGFGHTLGNSLRRGDAVSLRDKAKAMIVIRHNLDTIDRQVPAWLETSDGGATVTVRELPLREQIDVPVREQLIVELYSK